MWAPKVVLGAIAVLIGIIFWQAPSRTVERISADTALPPRDEWEKLRQQIQAHRNVHPRPSPTWNDSVKRPIDYASAPQMTEGDATAMDEPVQEQVEPIRKPSVEATSANEPTAVLPVPQKRKWPPKRRTRQVQQAQGLRLVRITTYENGQPVRVRSFKVAGVSKGGPKYKRFHLACPQGQCRPLSAALFRPGGAFN